MKFAVLDGQAHGKAHGKAHGQAHGQAHGDDHYTYLDDLLDKTFLTDYFLDRTTASASVP